MSGCLLAGQGESRGRAVAVRLSEEYRVTVAQVAKKAGLSEDLLIELLNLEFQHPNLHAYGARPALRREIAKIIEAAFEKEDGAKPSTS